LIAPAKYSRQACVHFVSISRQKIRKNSKTNETIRKEKISCFQTLSSQSLDIKQVRKTKGHESLLPIHSGHADFPWKFPFLSFNRVTIASALINRICHVFVTCGEIWFDIKRRKGLKIPSWLSNVPVRVRPSALLSLRPFVDISCSAVNTFLN
jgi:hypothetical protein